MPIVDILRCGDVFMLIVDILGYADIFRLVDINGLVVNCLGCAYTFRLVGWWSYVDIIRLFAAFSRLSGNCEAGNLLFGL